ncbi:MAG: phosphate signaling complex protein PhoU [Verrucomicrobiales bacterium]|nr:phosphate signaling complex protein PhoU [Verrucomicrobiales bacterium]
MPTHFEESLQRDIDRIRAKVRDMAGLCERALRDCLKALEERKRTLAYAVILSDQRIDELEKELDRLCLEFLVRQQPVAGPLRFVYATIRINLELERVGDYAEGIARQVLKLASMDVPIPFERFQEIANLSIPMLHDAVNSFVDQNAELARKTMATEETVDALKSRLNADLMNLNQDKKIRLEALNALMMIARHFERVSDQAKSICTEVLYMCTGEYTRHIGSEATRLLFVDVSNACRSQMAEAIANSLNQPHFIFSSAGLEPTAIDPMTVTFLKEKGLDLSRQSSKAVDQIPNLDHYQIVVALAKEVHKAFPAPPTKTVCLDWSIKDPSRVEGTPAEVRAAYEATYKFLHDHITGLVEAVLGNKMD